MKLMNSNLNPSIATNEILLVLEYAVSNILNQSVELGVEFFFLYFFDTQMSKVKQSIA